MTCGIWLRARNHETDRDDKQSRIDDGAHREAGASHKTTEGMPLVERIENGADCAPQRKTRESDAHAEQKDEAEWLISDGFNGTGLRHGSAADAERKAERDQTDHQVDDTVHDIAEAHEALAPVLSGRRALGMHGFTSDVGRRTRRRGKIVKRHIVCSFG